MGLLDETVSVPRRTMTLFFLIDTSGSMEGNKIGAVNDAVVNVKDVQDKYYFVYFKPDEDAEGTWTQIDPNAYNNNIVEELPAYPYIYLNGYWQELNIDEYIKSGQLEIYVSLFRIATSILPFA